MSPVLPSPSEPAHRERGHLCGSPLACLLLVRALVDAGARIVGVAEEAVTLEQVYLDLVGEAATRTPRTTERGRPMRPGYVWAVPRQGGRVTSCRTVCSWAPSSSGPHLRRHPDGDRRGHRGNELDPDQLGQIGHTLAVPRPPPKLAAQGFIVLNFLAYFLLIPAMVPMAIATQSVIGEKTSRSLEPQLATPMEVSEFSRQGDSRRPPGRPGDVGGLRPLRARQRVDRGSRTHRLIFNDVWRVAMLSLVPLICLLSVLLGIIVSHESTTRARRSRSAVSSSSRSSPSPSPASSAGRRRSRWSRC